MALLMRVREHVREIRDAIFPLVPSHPLGRHRRQERPASNEPEVELPERSAPPGAIDVSNQEPLEPAVETSAAVETVSSARQPQISIEESRDNASQEETPCQKSSGEHEDSLSPSAILSPDSSVEGSGTTTTTTTLESADNVTTARTSTSEAEAQVGTGQNASPEVLRPASSTSEIEVQVKICPVPSADILESLPSLDRSRRLHISNWETPLEVRETYEYEVYDRLHKDLAGARADVDAIRGVRTPILMDTIAMCGYASPNDSVVNLKPTIVIRHKKRAACEVMQAAVNQLIWIAEEFPQLSVTVVRSSASFSSVLGSEDVRGLDLSHGVKIAPDVYLYINVEDWQASTSACGLLCCATIQNGSAISHQICRIGGVVALENRDSSAQFGVSTAHTMLNNPWWLREVIKHHISIGNKLPPGFSTWDDVDGDISEDSDEDTDQGPSGRSEVLSTAVDPLRVSSWRNVTNGAALSFLGQVIFTHSATKMTPRSLFPAAPENSTDHALLRLDLTSAATWALPRKLVNSYYQGTSGDRAGPEPVGIVTYETNPEVPEGPVGVVCGEHTVISGRLVFGSASLNFAGQTFKVRKIILPEPLAMGVSGSWVVRGSVLCGMIVGIYDTAPYALMMTAKQLFDQLQTAEKMGGAVNLPGYEHPDPEPEPSEAPLQLDHIPDVDTITSLSLPISSEESYSSIPSPASPIRISVAESPRLTSTPGPIVPRAHIEPLIQVNDEDAYSRRSTSLESVEMRHPTTATGNATRRLEGYEGDEEDEASMRREQVVANILDSTISFRRRFLVMPALGLFAASYLLSSIAIIYPAVFLVWPPCKEIPSNPSLTIDAITLVGVILGSLICGNLADRFGRRRIQTSIIPILLVAISGLAQSSSGFGNTVMSFYAWFIPWRMLLGFGIGGQFVMSALHAAEWSTTEHRGVALAAVFLAQSLGQLVANALHYGLLKANQGRLAGLDAGDSQSTAALDATWRTLIGLGSIPVVLLAPVSFLIPESPRYYAGVQKTDLAPSDLKNLFGVSFFTRNLFHVYDENVNGAPAPRSVPWGSALFSPLNTYSNWHSSYDASPINESWSVKFSEYLKKNDLWASKAFRHLVVNGYWRSLAAISLIWMTSDSIFFTLTWYNYGFLNLIWNSGRPGSLTLLESPSRALACTDPSLWVMGDQRPLLTSDTLGRSSIGNLVLIAGGSAGSLLLIFLINYIRRPLSMYSASLYALFPIVVIFFVSFNYIPAIAFGLVVSSLLYLGLNMGSNAFTFILAPEIFPTRYRGSFVALAAASGKIGALVFRIIGNSARGRVLVGALLAPAVLMAFSSFVFWKYGWIHKPQKGKADGFGTEDVGYSEMQSTRNLREVSSRHRLFTRLKNRPLEDISAGKWRGRK